MKKVILFSKRIRTAISNLFTFQDGTGYEFQDGTTYEL